MIWNNIKVDLMKRKNNDIIVGEVRKFSRFEKSAIMQLAFYLYRLRQRGINAKGELMVPRGRKRIPVELTQDIEDELKQTFHQIKDIIAQDNPPEPVKNRYCTHCAYREFCWV